MKKMRASVSSFYKRICLILFIITLIFSINLNIFAFEIEEDTDYVWLKEEIANSDSVKEPVLNSRYAIAIDRDSKAVLYGKNENQKVPMASTTKIMTAIVLLENLEKNNNLTLNTEIEVCKQAAAVGGSRLELKTGDKITVKDLLYGLMLCSR